MNRAFLLVVEANYNYTDIFEGDVDWSVHTVIGNGRLSPHTDSNVNIECFNTDCNCFPNQEVDNPEKYRNFTRVTLVANMHCDGYTIHLWKMANFFQNKGFFQDSLWRSKVTSFFLRPKPVIVHALKIALNK